MATSNPYDPDAVKRAAQLAALSPVPAVLGQGAPGVNTAMGTDPAAAAAPSAAGLVGHRDPWSVAENVSGGDFGRLAGYDPTKFSGDENSLKYQIGHKASQYDPTGGVGQLFADPEFTKRYPNVKQAGNDSLDFGNTDLGFGTGLVDVIQNYGAPDAKWAWQPQGDAPTGGSQAAPAQQTPQIGSNLDSVMAEIMALSNGAESPLKRKELLDLLQDPSLQQAVP